MKSPFYKDKNGNKTWDDKAGDIYVVTGVDVYGKRFRIETGQWDYARGINVYKGSRWIVREGRRFLIHRVHN